MEIVRIETNKGTNDCEDCGFYDYGDFTMSFKDGTTLQGSHDGHLGSGQWDGELNTLYLWALEKLGYTVMLDGERPWHSEYLERNTESNWPDWVERPLFEGTPTVIELTLELVTDDASPSYEYPGKITVPALTADHVPLVLRAVAEGPGTVVNWDGDMTSVYRMLLEQVAQLSVVEHVEPDDNGY